MQFPPPQEPRRPQQPADLPGGRRRGAKPPVDSGTVGLAISGFTFYWMMPALARARRAQRRATPPAPPAELQG